MAERVSTYCCILRQVLSHDSKCFSSAFVCNKGAVINSEADLVRLETYWTGVTISGEGQCPESSERLTWLQRIKGDQRMKECETAHILPGNGYRIYIQNLKFTIHALSVHNVTKFTLKRRKTFERRESIIIGFSRCWDMQQSTEV